MIQLCYKLDSDKIKWAPTSISSDYELSAFHERMKDLIVPPKLANGKYSKKKMKSVRVIFSDSTDDSASKIAKKTKKVSSFHFYY